MKKYKLFIWRNVRCDYTPGIAFASATSKEEAIDAIHKASEEWEWNAYCGDLLKEEPEIRELPSGGWISGGG